MSKNITFTTEGSKMSSCFLFLSVGKQNLSVLSVYFQVQIMI